MLPWAGACQGADRTELFPFDIAFEPFLSRSCVEDCFIYHVLSVCVSKQANEDLMKQMFSAAVCADVSLLSLRPGCCSEGHPDIG